MRIYRYWPLRAELGLSPKTRLQREDTNPLVEQRDLQHLGADQGRDGDHRRRVHDESCPGVLAQIISRTCEPLLDLHVDVIVNAASKYIEGGGGVCGAIHSAAGEQLFEVCKATPGFCLPAK